MSTTNAPLYNHSGGMGWTSILGEHPYCSPGGSENTKLIFEPSDAVSDQLEHFPAVPAFGINRELIVD